MDADQVIIGLSTIVVLGVGAQWIARRRDFPSLLLLLPAGLVAGNLLDLDPEALFGDTFLPGVTLLVGLLLFHAGLQLRFTELPSAARGPVLRLITVGAAVTFLAGAAAVVWILDPGGDLALLAAAILVVSGPTVIGPLLNIVRPRQPMDAILRWEGTILDPIGATLGVVVLNLVLATERSGVHPVLQMGGRLALGVGIGVAAALLLVFVMSRFLVTDNMEAAVALLFAVAAFAAAEVVLSEAGLFATVAMGVVAANQRVVPTSHITGFGETLEVLIIGSLFVALGALVDLDDLLASGWRILALVAALVLVVRPLAVAVATVRPRTPWRERAFLAWLDPRGVVAAATAASFAGSLGAAGIDADFLLPTVFGVILGTGVVYGLSARPVASALAVRRPEPRGVAFVGNDGWLADLAARLRALGVPVLVITSNPEVRLEDRAEAVPTMSLQDPDADLRDGLARWEVSKALVSLGPDWSASMLVAELVEALGRRHVYRLLRGTETAAERRLETAATALAFGPSVTDDEIARRLAAGATVGVLDADTAGGSLPLVVVSPAGLVELNPSHAGVGAGGTVIGLRP